MPPPPPRGNKIKEEITVLVGESVWKLFARFIRRARVSIGMLSVKDKGGHPSTKRILQYARHRAVTYRVAIFHPN